MAKWLALGCSITDFRVSRELGSHPVHPSGRASGEAGVSGKISQFNRYWVCSRPPSPCGRWKAQKRPHTWSGVGAAGAPGLGQKCQVWEGLKEAAGTQPAAAPTKG